MSLGAPRFEIGQNVLYLGTNQVGTINKVIKGARGYSYRVTIDGKLRNVQEKWLEPLGISEDKILDDFIDGKLGDHNDYNLFQTWFRLSRPLESNLYSYLGSKTVFNPHQFKPLLKFLSPNSDGRLFIADEVGVGKTIESGIIITELLARGILDHKTPIWIVCPNSLTYKWRNEMKERFNLDFFIQNGKSLKFTLESFRQNGIFPQRYLFSIVSLQLLRHDNYLPLIRQIDDQRNLPIFGLIVIDEAHHMRNMETNSNELGNLLSTLTEMILMLSATPLNLRSEDLYNQMHILNPNLFPDKTTFQTMHNPVTYLNRIRRLLGKNDETSRSDIINQFQLLEMDPVGEVLSTHPSISTLKQNVIARTKFTSDDIVRYDHALVSASPMYSSFNRTRKREAFEHQVHREAWEVAIQLSENELLFHQSLLNAIQSYYLRKGGNPVALGFVTNMYRRMISSSIPAMRQYLQWAINENQVMTFEHREIEDEIEDDSNYSLGSLDPQLRDEFIILLQESQRIEHIDSKYNQFKDIIEKILSNPETPQVIVFSFFIRTLEYLKKRLETDGYKIGVIHGKIPLQSNPNSVGRYQIIDQFKNMQFDILLSSEVGGEGLDFQFCNVIINYDLPYNPMRIEQRIGRIDRFGQKSDKIIIANLFIKQTVDEEIYDRLYRRIRIVEDGIGILEPILGTHLSNMQTQLLTGQLTKDQKDEISIRIETAVASARLQMEEFENHRGEILSDDYLSKPINRLSESSFVTPKDAMMLTNQCLNTWDNCKFTIKNDFRGEISLSPAILSNLENFVQKPGNEMGHSELATLFSHQKGLNVIFDGSSAFDYPGHTFLAPTGMWSKFLVNELEREGQISRVFGFHIGKSESSLDSGDYITFIYEVKMEGVKTEIDFDSTTLNVLSNKPVNTPSNFLRNIAENPNSNPLDGVPNININDFFETAREVLEEAISQKHSEAEIENEYKVESRIKALEKSSNIRINQLKQIINNHYINRNKGGLSPDDLFLRLTRGKIDKEKERLSDRVEILNAKKVLTLDYSLEGIIYLKVEDE